MLGCCNFACSDERGDDTIQIQSVHDLARFHEITICSSDSFDIIALAVFRISPTCAKRLKLSRREFISFNIISARPNFSAFVARSKKILKVTWPEVNLAFCSISFHSRIAASTLDPQMRGKECPTNAIAVVHSDWSSDEPTAFRSSMTERYRNIDS